jgi:hypothetical protein
MLTATLSLRITLPLECVIAMCVRPLRRLDFLCAEFCRFGGIAHIKDLIRTPVPSLEMCHRLCFPTIRFLCESQDESITSELGQLKVWLHAVFD